MTDHVNRVLTQEFKKEKSKGVIFILHDLQKHQWLQTRGPLG